MSGTELVTQLVARSTAGEGEATAAMFSMVYDELRRLAASALRRQRAPHTLQPTALVHEAFVRLVGSPDLAWSDRAHFVAIAARAIRHVLVDHARQRATLKRGRGEIRLTLDDIDVPAVTTDVDLLVLDAALARLASMDDRQARIVELRFFGGLSVQETAVLVDVSERTVKREWQSARAWLKRELAHASSAR